MASYTLNFRAATSGVVTGTATVRQLSTTQGGSNTAGTGVKFAKSVNTWQWVPGTASNTTTISIGTTPDQKGWLWDTTPVGAFAAGTWTFNYDLFASTPTGTGVMHVNMWVVTATTTAVTSVTQVINNGASSGFSPPGTQTGETFTVTSVPAFSVAANQYLYIETYWAMTSASSANTGSITFYLDNTAGSRAYATSTEFSLTASKSDTITLSDSVTATITGGTPPLEVNVSDTAYTGEVVTITNSTGNGTALDSITISEEVFVSPPYGAAISTLTDNFNSGSVDGAKWTTYTLNNGTVAQDGQKLILTPALFTEGSMAALISLVGYNLTGGSVFCEVPQVTGGTSTLTGLRVSASDNILNIENYFAIYAVNNELDWVYTTTTNGNGWGFVAPYDAVDQRWWRIRESGGTIYWDYSADSVNWTNFNSQALSMDFTRVYVYLLTNELNSQSVNPAWFDNLNLSPSLDTIAVSEVVTITNSTGYSSVSDAITGSEVVSITNSNANTSISDSMAVGETVIVEEVTVPLTIDFSQGSWGVRIF